MSENASFEGGVEGRADERRGGGDDDDDDDEDDEGVILDASWEVVDTTALVVGVDKSAGPGGQEEGAGGTGGAAADDAEASENKADADAAAAMPLPLHWTRLGLPPPPLPQAESDEPCDGDGGATVAVRRPQDVVTDPIDPSELELVIVGTAGQKINSMGDSLQELVNPKLEQLVLRSHLIRELQGIDRLADLELLELYDNQLTSLDGLALRSDQGASDEGTAETRETSTATSHRVSLRVLDMSYNVIRDMDPVQFCPHLQELYLANNKLRAMAGLENLSRLRKLDLGANRIRFMDPAQLAGLTSLEELWLGKNKIEKVEGLDKLVKLRRLDLQSNRLTSVENLTSQVDTLEELYLSHNGIDSAGCSQPTGLALQFACLTVLDVSRNRVDSTAPFAHLTTLEELWLSGNQIATFEQVKPASQLTNLETIYLEHNPVQASDPLYRKTLAALIPNLKQIDANLISATAASSYVAPPGPAARAPPALIASVASSEAEELRQLQEAALERARAETEAKRKAPTIQNPPGGGDEDDPRNHESEAENK